MTKEYSIIATSYNDEKEIETFLDNILKQTVQPSEIIIADGGSRDNTVKIITEKAKNNPIIKVVTNGRLNISQGYNLAIRNVKSNLIGVVGIGNVYEEQYFERLLEINENTNIDMVYSPIRGVNSSRFSVSYNNTFLNGEYGQRIAVPSNHGALIKKEVFENNGFFYEKFIYAGEDTEFYTRAIKNGASSIMVENAVVRWKSPVSMLEYFKLIKNYGIALLQIKSNLSLFKIIAKRLGLLLIIILLLILLPVFMKNILLMAMIVVFVKKYYRLVKKKKSIGLLMIEYYMYPLVYLRYCKYMAKKYKVARGS